MHSGPQTLVLIQCFKNFRPYIRKEKNHVVDQTLLITNLWTEFSKFSSVLEWFSKRFSSGLKSSVLTLKSTFSHIFESFLKILSTDSWSVKNLSWKVFSSFWILSVFSKNRKISDFQKNTQKPEIHQFSVFRLRKNRVYTF